MCVFFLKLSDVWFTYNYDYNISISQFISNFVLYKNYFLQFKVYKHK